ncbi:MAG: glycosyltransferase family 1 protein, partial [Dehalococcoidia bacterium]|nr:glycosyltransferase family 1 protein [Dehalococcoidia bacterium]
MRLALVIYGDLTLVSGGYLYDRMLVEHLRACGDTVDVVSLNDEGYFANLRHNWDGALFRRL